VSQMFCSRRYFTRVYILVKTTWEVIVQSLSLLENMLAYILKVY